MHAISAPLKISIAAITFAVLSTAGLQLAHADDSTTRPATTDRPVEQKLTAMANQSAAKNPVAAKIFGDGVASVAATGIVDQALKVGDKAPMFELPDSSGKMIKLADLLQKGPVVLNWYRGGWCPYCNIELHGLLEAEPQIRDLGAALVAISPETPDSAAQTVDKDHLTFEVLSDKGNQVAHQYRIVYKLPEKVSAAMKSHKVDLTKRNGDSSDELPLAVTYVIDTDSTIRWAFVSADYRKRAEPSDVIGALKKLR